MPESSPPRALEQRLADLGRVAALTQPILRNLLITQRYHDLSHDLTGALGRADANFIAELFRVNQRDSSWFDQPFEANQRTEFEAGRVPAGKL
jgi:hypothetical protein